MYHASYASCIIHNARHKEDDLKNEDNLKNEDDLKNEDNFKNEKRLQK